MHKLAELGQLVKTINFDETVYLQTTQKLVEFGRLTARISRDSPTRQYVQIANLM